jgi:hypothetical protein
MILWVLILQHIDSGWNKRLNYSKTIFFGDNIKKNY